MYKKIKTNLYNWSHHPPYSPSYFFNQASHFLSFHITQAAGPLFVAAADFQRQVSSAEFQRQLSTAPGTEALKMMSLLIHVMEPYVNGFSYQPSITADPPYWYFHLVLYHIIYPN